MKDLLLDKKIRERYILGIVNGSLNWQWLIDYIEREFKFKNWKDWYDFKRILRIPEPIDIFYQVIKNEKVDIDSLHFSNKYIKQMWYIACFCNNEISWKEVSEQISDDSLKLILLDRYITQLFNKDNNVSFDFYWNFFINTNLFQVYSFEAIQRNQVIIKRYLNTIKLCHIGELKKVFTLNIRKIKQEYNGKLLGQYNNNLFSYNAFSFQYLPSSNNLPWQENLLINMVDTKYDGTKLLPAIHFSNGSDYPNIGKWSTDVLKYMKDYFGQDNTVSNFVIETVYYFKNRVNIRCKKNKKYIPSIKVIKCHLQLLVKAIDQNLAAKEIVSSSSMYFLGCLFKDHCVSSDIKNSNYRKIINWIGMQTDILIEKKLKFLQLPISKHNQIWIEESDKRRLVSLEIIENTVDFTRYLNQDNLYNFIKNSELDKISKKFMQLLHGKVNVKDLPDLFIDYAKFLSKCFNNNKLDKSKLNFEIIKIQQLWKNYFFKKSNGSMIEKSLEFSLPNKVVKGFQEEYEKNPIKLAAQLLPLSEEKFVREMQLIDETPLLSISKKVEIERVFPQIKSSVELKHHKVEMLFIKYIRYLQTRYQGLFFNSFSAEDILPRILDSYYLYMNNIFILDKKAMYKNILISNKYLLSPYDEEINLGIVTQLFPVLEDKIRHIAARCIISPFKNNSFNDTGVKYNDPSSLLMKIICYIYEDKKDLISAQGFVFVYLVMYDSNFLNIRNELIHGRRFLEKTELEFAFRCTMLSINIIDYYLANHNKNEDQ